MLYFLKVLTLFEKTENLESASKDNCVWIFLTSGKFDNLPNLYVVVNINDVKEFWNV